MIEKLQKLIDESNNIVCFTGAGVSTESGLKDFRGKNGLYKENNEYPPEYLLSHACLMTNPKLFFNYYKNNLNYKNIKPNITHLYLKKLEDGGKLKAVITQNIDGLHESAGNKNVILLHGTTKRSYCISCGKYYEGDYIYKCNGIPKCSCGGIVRPDVVLYGEGLGDAFNKALHYIDKCDLLIVAGTSLTVEPACSLVKLNKSKLVIINEDKTAYDNYATLLIHDSLGNVFSKLK